MKIVTVLASDNALDHISIDGLVADADLVINLPIVGGKAKVSDRWGRPHEVSYVEVDSPAMAFIECAKRIKRAWEECVPDKAHLGHAAFGTWWSYWLSPAMETMDQLVAQGKTDELRAAAKDYIEAEFGELRGPTLENPDVESQIPAGLLPA